MEEIFARRKARLMELRARRKGEDGEPKRLAARPVFDKCPSCGAEVPKTDLSHSLYVRRTWWPPMCWASPDMRRSGSASGIRLA